MFRCDVIFEYYHLFIFFGEHVQPEKLLNIARIEMLIRGMLNKNAWGHEWAARSFAHSRLRLRRNWSCHFFFAKQHSEVMARACCCRSRKTFVRLIMGSVIGSVLLHVYQVSGETIHNSWFVATALWCSLKQWGWGTNCVVAYETKNSCWRVSLLLFKQNHWGRLQGSILHIQIFCQIVKYEGPKGYAAYHWFNCYVFQRRAINLKVGICALGFFFSVQTSSYQVVLWS